MLLLKAVLEKGVRNVEILKQNEGSPLPVEHQVAIIYAGTKGLLNAVPVNEIKAFEEQYLGHLEAKHKDTLEALKAGKYTGEETAVLEKVIEELTAKYKSTEE